MARLPVMSGREVVRAFEKFGWYVARPGNHIILVKEGARASLSVPDLRKSREERSEV